MRKFTAKSYHAFAKSLADSLSGKSVINADVIKQASAPLLFGMDSHAAIASLKAEPKTAAGALSSCTDPESVSRKLEELSGIIKLRTSYQNSVKLIAQTLALEAEDFLSNKDCFPAFSEFLSAMKDGMTRLASGDFSTSQISFTGCDSDDLFTPHMPNYDKDLEIIFGSVNFSINATFNDCEYSGLCLVSSDFLINGISMDEYFQSEESDEEDGILASFRATLLNFMTIEEENVANPEVSASPELVKMIISEFS